MDELDELDIEALSLDDEADEAAEADEADAKRGRGRRRVGARLYTIIPKTTYDFTWLQSGTTTVVLRRALMLSPHYHYWFGLRIHNKDFEAATSTMTLQIFNTLPSSQDPQEFTETATSTTIQVLTADAVPSLKLATKSNLGPYFKLVLSVFQGGAAPPDRLYAELSAVLLARPT